MADLPTIGTAWYNGYEFSSRADTLEFRGTPVYDSSGRTITHTVFTLTIQDYIANGESDAPTLLAIVRLTQPAAGLVYSGRGFSIVSINLGSSNDVLWGPKPRVVSLTPMGGPGKTVKIVWTVDWAIPTCGDGTTKPGSPMEWCYKLNFSQDRSGYTVRTYTGHLRVAQTRSDIKNRNLQVSADEWRERVTPPELSGFRRTYNWELSEDKCVLSWTITDEEMPPNAPPPGIVEAEASHDFTNEGGKLLQWTGTIAAKYEVAKNASVGKAVAAFFALMNDRIGNVRAKVRQVKVEKGAFVPIPDQNGIVIPWQFSASENQIYGRTVASFRCVYRVTAVDLAQILQHGGLWRPAPSGLDGLARRATKGKSSYDLWAASMKNTLGPRGNAQLVFTPGADDRIVDLCALSTPAPPGSRNLDPNSPIQTLLDLANIFMAGSMVKDAMATAFAPPDAKSSWLDYRVSTVIEPDGGTVVTKTLPTAPLAALNRSPSGTWNASTGGLPVSSTLIGTPFPPLPDAGNLGTQRRTSPSLYIRLVGSAIRVGFPVPVPELVTVGGASPTLLSRVDRGEGFAQAVIGNVLVPVYAARWNLAYAVNDVPKTAFPPPGNEVQGVRLATSLLG